MRLAVIPARGGSKRIPRKNIRPFAGKPMIAWSIEAALESGCFDRVVVSTEDDEVAAVARAGGASVPFRRPPDLADDHAGTMPVIRHAVEWLAGAGDAPEHVCCILATAPFLRVQDLRAGLEALLDSGRDFAFPVTTFAFPIQRALRIDDQGRISMFSPENYAVRSQDLEPAYHDAAQFYWGRAEAWLAERPVYSERSVPLFLPRHLVQDIDTPEDWERAEWMRARMDASGSAPGGVA